MEPITSSSPSAAPVGTVLPDYAPATPTPSPKVPQGGPSKKATPTVARGDSDPSFGPKATTGPRIQQDPQQPNPQNLQAPESDALNPSSNDPPIRDPPSNNDPSSNDPSKTSPNSNKFSNNDPSKSDRGSSDPLSYNDASSSNPPIKSDPTSKAQASNNDPASSNPSNNDPSANDSPGKSQSSNYNPPSNKIPSSVDPSKNDPNSIAPGPISSSPHMNARSQNHQNHGQASGDPDNTNSVQPQGLGAQIASAFGHIPVTASPVTDANVPNPEPKVVEGMISGSPSPVMVGGSPIQKAANGAVFVAGQTVPQGGQASVSGVAVSVGSNNVAIDGNNHAFSPLASETPTPFIVGGNTAQRASDGGLIVGSQTLTPGAQATVAGIVVFVDNSNAILDRTTHNLAPITPNPLSVIVNGVTTTLQPAKAGASQAPVINVGGQDITLSQPSPSVDIAGQPPKPGETGQGSPYIVAGQTLTPGGAAIRLAGIPISLPAGQTLAANAPAMAIGAPPTQAGGSAPRPNLITVGNQVFTPNPSAFAIAGTTVSAGGSGVTIAGTVLSLQSAGSALVIGSSTLAVPAPVASLYLPTPVTIDNQIFTPNPSAFAIAGTTISAGGPGVTVDGTVVSLQASGAGLVVGSSTLAFTDPLSSQAVSPGPVTIGTQVFTPNPTGFSIAGTAISAGEPGITVDGTVISLEASGGGLVIGSSTLALASQSPIPSPVTIGSQVFTTNPTGFSIADTSISAGGVGVTVDGTMISLQPLSMGGGLVVGSSTIGLVGTGTGTGTETGRSIGSASATSASRARGVTPTSSGGNAPPSSNTMNAKPVVEWKYDRERTGHASCLHWR